MPPHVDPSASQQQRMLILAIDTSTRFGSVALLRDRQVLDVVSSHEESPYSTRLFRDLEVLQSRAQFRIEEFEVFAVAAGPGSFTGLRIGLTAVKAWAEVYRKPIAAISGLEAIAVQARPDEPKLRSQDCFLAPFLDARGGRVFGAVYRCAAGDSSSLELVGEESILGVEEFLLSVRKGIGEGSGILVSSTPDVIPSSLIDSILPGTKTCHVSGILAPFIGQLAFDRAAHGKLIDSLELDANYVRRSDAEVTWKGVS
jgi:tRNA threonylcarbamoyladenosine biosynthesis protein TsaB